MDGGGVAMTKLMGAPMVKQSRSYVRKEALVRMSTLERGVSGVQL